MLPYIPSLFSSFSWLGQFPEMGGTLTSFIFLPHRSSLYFWRNEHFSGIICFILISSQHIKMHVSIAGWC